MWDYRSKRLFAGRESAYPVVMAGPIRTTPSGFEIWKQDRTTGRDVVMTRADEDRFCDALREAFGDFMVVKMNGSWPTPEIEWRERITDFSSQFRDYTNPAVAQSVFILFPWPGWKLTGEKFPWERDRPDHQFSYGISDFPPLSITFERSALLGTEYLPKFKWNREAWIGGRYYVSYCSEGPYVEAQKIFIRKLRSLVGKMITRKLQFLGFDEKGRPADPNAWSQRHFLWAGDDAVRWAREDESRLLTEECAANRELGVVRYGYRPLD